MLLKCVEDKKVINKTFYESHCQKPECMMFCIVYLVSAQLSVIHVHPLRPITVTVKQMKITKDRVA